MRPIALAGLCAGSIAALAVLAAGAPAAAQAYAPSYGQPLYVGPPAHAPVYVPLPRSEVRGYGRRGGYLPDRHVYVPAAPRGYGYADRYGYRRDHHRHGHGHGYGYGHDRHGHGYARGDFGRPGRGYHDTWGYQDDRAPAYGRVHGGYAWIPRAAYGWDHGCNCAHIPLYD